MRVGAALLCIVGLVAASSSGGEPKRRGTILFVRGDHAFLMSADGTNQRPAPVRSYPTYSPDGRKIVFSTRVRPHREQLYVASSNGRNRRALSRVRIDYDACFWPMWSPSSKRIAYEAGCEVDSVTIYIVNRDGSGLRKLDPGYWQAGPVWSPDGRTILFKACVHRCRAGWRLFLIDPATRRRHLIRGTYPDPLLWDWSPDGKKIYFLAKIRDELRLFVMRRDGTGVRRLSPGGLKVNDHDVAPDGRTIVFTAAPDVGHQDWELYLVKSDGSGVRQVTDNRAFDVGPAWSPDGRMIAFTRSSADGSKIYVMNGDGSDQTNLSGKHDSDGGPSLNGGPSWVPRAR